MNSLTLKLSLVISMIVIDVFKTSANVDTSISPKECGVTSLSDPKSRLVGAANVEKATDFPWMVSLQTSKGQHFCGGAILNKRWIVSAAHCVHNAPVEQLVVGKTDLSKASDETNVYQMEKRILNGCYFQSSFNTDNDIALIKTKRDIAINNRNIASICLPKSDSEPNGTDITLMGWGVYEEMGVKSADILQTIGTTLFPEEYCQTYEYFRNLGFMWNENGKRICFKSDLNTACFGDSGGPAIQIRDGKAIHVGIASYISGTVDQFLVLNNIFRLNLIKRCPKGNPVFYAKTSKYVDWIRNAIDKYGNSNTNTTTKC